MPRAAQETPGYTIPGIVASDAITRADDVLGEIEKLADDLYTISRVDPADNLGRVGAMERLEAAVRAALATWRMES